MATSPVTPRLVFNISLNRAISEQVDPLTEEEFKTDLLKQAMPAYEEAYRDLKQHLRSIDEKAQGTAGLAGVFLAGAFAYSRDFPADANPGVVSLLIVVVVSLISSAVIALWSQRVRELPSGPQTSLVHQWIADISQLSKFDPSELTRQVYEEYARSWGDTNNKLIRIVHIKATILRYAQATLVFAGILVAVLTILIVMNEGEHLTQGGYDGQLYFLRY